MDDSRAVIEPANPASPRAAAIAALPDTVITDPHAQPWLEAEALADIDLFGHLHDEHLPSIRDWLASRG